MPQGAQPSGFLQGVDRTILAIVLVLAAVGFLVYVYFWPTELRAPAHDPNFRWTHRNEYREKMPATRGAASDSPDETGGPGKAVDQEEGGPVR